MRQQFQAGGQRVEAAAVGEAEREQHGIKPDAAGPAQTGDQGKCRHVHG